MTNERKPRTWKAWAVVTPCDELYREGPPEGRLYLYDESTKPETWPEMSEYDRVVRVTITEVIFKGGRRG